MLYLFLRSQSQLRMHKIMDHHQSRLIYWSRHLTLFWLMNYKGTSKKTTNLKFLPTHLRLNLTIDHQLETLYQARKLNLVTWIKVWGPIMDLVRLRISRLFWYTNNDVTPLEQLWIKPNFGWSIRWFRWPKFHKFSQKSTKSITLQPQLIWMSPMESSLEIMIEEPIFDLATWTTFWGRILDFVVLSWIKI